MNEPLRLRDDPAFQELSNNALGDEALALGPYDLAGLREKVVRGEPSGPSGPSWPTMVGISGITAALVSVALWMLLPMAQVLPPLQPTVAPRVLQVGELLHSKRTLLVEPPSEEKEIPPAVHTPPPQPVAAVIVPTPVVPVVKDSVVKGPIPALPSLVLPPPKRGLEAELADYNRALDAAEAQRWSESRERYAAYLESWPKGRLRNEAQLGLLSALVKTERPTEAEALAARLLQDITLSGRAADIRLLRAEALVELDRCDEALQSLEGRKRSGQTSSIRAACRRRNR